MTRTTMPRGSTGFSLPAAIFLLVVMAALGAFMLTLSTTQQVASAQDIQGAQAFRAARAGIEWGAVKIQGAAACPPSPSALTVDDYAVSVICTSHAYDEGGTSRAIYWLEATATKGGSPGGIGYIERIVSSFVEF